MDERVTETIDTYNKSAQKYQDKFMKMDMYNDTYEQFCNFVIVEDPQIFEVGVGPGNITKYLHSLRPDFNVFGIDLAPRMIELARINNPKAVFEVMDCRKIDQVNRYFDAIVAGFCLPYLSKEESATFIEASSKILNAKGLLYISTMEDSYDKSGFETTSFSGDNKVYIYYHQEEFLSKCLISSGFEIISLQRKYYPEPNGTFLTDMIFIARKM